jgi:hypothetical protein
VVREKVQVVNLITDKKQQITIYVLTSQIEKLGNKTLSLLSLLIIHGILLMHVFWSSHLVLLSISMCAIGGLSFGILIGRR